MRPPYIPIKTTDSPSEDITAVLYDTFDFIERARCGAAAECSGGGAAADAAAAGGGARADADGRDQRREGRGSPRQQQQQSAAARDRTAAPGEAAAPPLSQEPGAAAAASTSGGAEQVLPGSSTGADGGGGSGSGSGSGSGADGGGGGTAGGGGGGRVLVHCSQGVSRSTALAIAYLMWKLGQPYDEVYKAVRALRGVASPNIGFTCQLLQWQKRRARPPARARLYRVAPHAPEAPLYLVPRAAALRPGASRADRRCLDPRGCFVVHLPGAVYVWRGASCVSLLQRAGRRFAAQLAAYEGAPPAVDVEQGAALCVLSWAVRSRLGIFFWRPAVDGHRLCLLSTPAFRQSRPIHLFESQARSPTTSSRRWSRRTTPTARRSPAAAARSPRRPPPPQRRRPTAPIFWSSA